MKDWIEDIVVAELARIVDNDELVEEFADRFMEWQAGQETDSVLVGLETQLRQVEKAIENNMSLIDSGFITDSIKSHLVELESQRASLEVGISKEKLAGNAPKLGRDSVIWFLKRFRTDDQTDVSWRIYIIETFLKAAYLYDGGRLLLHLNFSGDKSTVSLQIAEKTVAEGQVLSSSFAHSGVPSKQPFSS